MRSFYLIVVMAILLPLSLISKPFDSNDALKNTQQQSIDWSKVGVPLEDVVKVKLKDAPAPQMAFKILETDQDYFWSSMFDGLTPLAYEPNSNTLVYVTTDRQRIGNWSTAYVYLHFSQDNGQTWTKTQVFSKPESMAMFPSVAVLNPNHETDPEKFKIVVSYSYFKPRPTPTDTLYYASGNYYLYFNGQDGWDGVLDFDEEGPTKNNVGGSQKWGTTSRRMMAVSSPKGDHFFVYGTLSPDDGYQYGAYGLAYIDFTESDADPNSQIVPQWSFSAFKPSTELGSSYNAPMRLSADDEGNIYAFVNNIFDDGTFNRLPAFSKSTDNGNSWSEFQVMPFSKYEDFLSNWNHNFNINLGYSAYPFSTWSAVVTGNDEFSMFVRLLSYVGTSQNDAVGTGHYAEISYKNGSWQPVKRVSELYMEPFMIYNVGTTFAKDTLNKSYRYNELEAAKTADGKSLVLKYVDADKDNMAVLSSTVTLVGDPSIVLDSLLATDIFVAYRNLSDENWTLQNITKDKWYNRGTYMPYIVPSISNVPIAEYVSGEITNFEDPRSAYPLFVTNMIGDRSSAVLPAPPLNTILISSFDFNNPAPINNPTIQNPKGLIASVIENLPFALKDIAPNPANEFATLSFNLDYSANVVVNIHNAMGQIVKNVYNGFANEGMNNLNILTNDLPTGAYFYTINVNGKSQTKLLNVIR